MQWLADIWSLCRDDFNCQKHQIPFLLVKSLRPNGQAISMEVVIEVMRKFKVMVLIVIKFIENEGADDYGDDEDDDEECDNDKFHKRGR